MPDRKMFWRIIRRIFASNRARLLVILLALGAGATVTAALLNLQIDAKRRLTTEFRAFGPNVIVSPREQISSPNGATLSETLAQELGQVATVPGERPVSGVALLYVIAEVSVDRSAKFVPVVVAGRRVMHAIDRVTGASAPQNDQQCSAGSKVAEQLRLRAGEKLVLRDAGAQATCQILAITSSGGTEDNQVSVDLGMSQHLAGLPGRISLIQLRVEGTPAVIDKYVASAAQRFPQAEVRPIRQFTEGEAKIYDRISGILSATVVLVLVLTALCVMAAMTNVAMERRNDVGLMKAIGGATRRVLRLFLAEAALLGLTGGVLGAAIGILLSMWLGKAVFGIAARPRLIVYPVTVALTIIVAIAGAYPLRRLANIRPASVFRGEA
ncbi:MAG: hypothetical protein JWO71_3988 [Candidatus Acidoferrum typicum]|nr:hypothetical protein [Candidatus Acidoferrum typicum]